MLSSVTLARWRRNVRQYSDCEERIGTEWPRKRRRRERERKKDERQMYKRRQAE